MLRMKSHLCQISCFHNILRYILFYVFSFYYCYILQVISVIYVKLIYVQCIVIMNG